MKLMIAVGSCLKQWSSAQWVLGVLKQSFSISQRLCPDSQRMRLGSWFFERVLAQYHWELTSFSHHWPATRSRRCLAATDRSTRNGSSNPSQEVKPSSSLMRLRCKIVQQDV